MPLKFPDLIAQLVIPTSDQDIKMTKNTRSYDIEKAWDETQLHLKSDSVSDWDATHFHRRIKELHDSSKIIVDDLCNSDGSQILFHKTSVRDFLENFYILRNLNGGKDSEIMTIESHDKGEKNERGYPTFTHTLKIFSPTLNEDGSRKLLKSFTFDNKSLIKNSINPEHCERFDRLHAEHLSKTHKSLGLTSSRYVDPSKYSDSTLLQKQHISEILLEMRGAREEIETKYSNERLERIEESKSLVKSAKKSLIIAASLLAASITLAVVFSVAIPVCVTMVFVALVFLANSYRKYDASNSCSVKKADEQHRQEMKVWDSERKKEIRDIAFNQSLLA